jgi:hypothetical protein
MIVGFALADVVLIEGGGARLISCNNGARLFIEILENALWEAETKGRAEKAPGRLAAKRAINPHKHLPGAKSYTSSVMNRSRFA